MCAIFVFSQLWTGVDRPRYDKAGEWREYLLSLPLMLSVACLPAHPLLDFSAQSAPSSSWPLVFCWDPVRLWQPESSASFCRRESTHQAFAPIRLPWQSWSASASTVEQDADWILNCFIYSSVYVRQVLISYWILRINYEEDKFDCFDKKSN